MILSLYLEFKSSRTLCDQMSGQHTDIYLVHMTRTQELIDDI